MYWNNPLIEIKWPSALDPITDSLHGGNHCLFYNPFQDKNKVQINQTLLDLCNWANNTIQSSGIHDFLKNTRNHDFAFNLVKINLWVDDLLKQGSIKPMLLHYVGQPLLKSATGESRLKALERIKSISTVSSFISTHCQYQKEFEHLESITNLNRFAEICQAKIGQTFLFRLTNDLALYGLDWYEYNSYATAQVTPGHDYCITGLSNYLKQHPNIIFTPEWFDTLVDWNLYQ